MESLIKIDQVADELKAIPAQIESHKTRVMKAEAVGTAIIQAVEDNGGEMTDEIDERANKFLSNCTKAKKEMEDARKPATQILDLIRKQFTEQESKLDAAKGPVVSKVQELRNAFAKAKFEEAERVKREAAEKAAREKAKADARISIESELEQSFGNALIQKKTAIQNSFNAITLDNYAEKADSLKKMPIEAPDAAIAKLIETFKQTAVFKFPNIQKSEVIDMIDSAIASFPLSAWKNGFAQQIQEVKDQLIDRLPALKTELETKAAASEEEKKRLEAERQKRIDEENARLAKEKADQEAAALAREEQKKAAANAEIMFDQVIEEATAGNGPEARTGFDIVVLHPAGWVEIFQLWFQRKGATMDVESIGATKLDSMKTFVEKLAKDEDVRIESKNIRYEQKIKAVNRKK